MGGKTNERIEVPIINERQKQAYYGTLNVYNQKFLVNAFEKADEEVNYRFLTSFASRASPVPYCFDLGGCQLSSFSVDYHILYKKSIFVMICNYRPLGLYSNLDKTKLDRLLEFV